MKSASGLAVDCSPGDANITIRNTLNGTNVVDNQAMTKIETGIYNYTYSTGVQSTFLAIAKCTTLTIEYTGITEFSTQNVSGTGGGSGGSSTGGLPLNVFSSVGAFYSPNDQVSVFATVTDSSGVLKSATVNNSVFYPNGSLLVRGLSNELNTGVFNFSFNLPARSPAGTYQVRLDANLSSDEIHDVLSFVISQTLEDIASTVDNINTTIISVNETIIRINTTVNNIQSDVTAINSTVSDIHTTVNNIDTTVTNINTVITRVDTIVSNINTTVNNINTTVNEINSTVNNIDTTVTNTNTVITRVDTIVNNINTTVENINSTIVLINSTVNNINSRTQSINSTVVLINSVVNNITDIIDTFEAFSTVGSFYSPGDVVTIYTTATDTNGNFVSPTINHSIHDSNGTRIISGNASELTTGIFNFSFVLPTTAGIGTYLVQIDSTYGSDQHHEVLSFIVSSGIELIKSQVSNVSALLSQINSTTQSVSNLLTNTIVPKLDDANDSIFDVLDKWGTLNATVILTNVSDTNQKVTEIVNDTQALIDIWGTYRASQLFDISNDTLRELTARLSEINSSNLEKFDKLGVTLNSTHNNTLAMLDLIGRTGDSASANTLFGEQQSTRDTLDKVEGNLTLLLNAINVTANEINTSVNSILGFVDDLENMHQCSLSPNS